ncbi:MAG: YfiR family protein [Acidobacteriota bacterium]
MTMLSPSAYLILAGMLLPALCRAGGLEDQMKAIYVTKMTDFIEWPAEPGPGIKAEPYVIGVIGKTPVLPFLEEMAGRWRIGGHPVSVRNISQLDEIPGCRILFVAGSEEHRLGEILDKAAGRPILTVGDTKGYGEKGILINFYVESDYLRFEINVRAAHTSTLKFSSKLLKLARIVS